MRGSVLLAVCCFAACGGFAYLVYDAALPLERPLECGQPDGVLACPSDAATRARIDATVHKKNGSAIGRSPKHQRVHSKASTKSIHSKTKKEHHEKHPLKSKSRLPKKEKAQKKPQREPSSPSRIDIAEQKETALLRAAPDKGQQWTRSANRPRPLEAPRQIVRPAVKLDRNTGVHLALQKKLNWETADDLSKFGWKYGTDKSTNHRYTPYYHQVFTPVRNTTHTLLEVGVFKGESLKMWRDYFTNSMIYGIDYFRGNADGTWGELNRRVKLDAKFGPRVAMFDVNQSSIVEMEPTSHLPYSDNYRPDVTLNIPSRRIIGELKLVDPLSSNATRVERRGAFVPYGNTMPGQRAAVYGRAERGAKGDRDFDPATGQGYVASLKADYSSAIANGVDVRLLLFETFGGFSPAVMHLLRAAADDVGNKLSRSQYLDEVSWSTRNWTSLQCQRLSVKLNIACAQEIAGEFGGCCASWVGAGA